MTRPLVIGYGNSLRQDDGVGLRAADLLEERLDSGMCEIVRCQQLTPELVAKLESPRVAIFLDASVDRPFQSVTLTRVRLGASSVGFSHHLTPGLLLDLAQALHGQAPPAFVVTAGLRDFELRDSLTSVGEASAARMADLAFRLIVESTADSHRHC
jgi:hydrogenase maturation protease